MRRIAMLLSMAGVIVLGVAATPAPAQAQDGWRGYPNAREQAWREHQRREWAWRHRQWREHHYQEGDNFR